MDMASSVADSVTVQRCRRGSSEPIHRRVLAMGAEDAAERTFTTPEEAIEAAFATPRYVCLTVG